MEYGRADHFIIEISGVIKRLVTDHLHIIGDVFDRGPGPQLVMENRPDEEIQEVLDFCVSVGLPITLKQLGCTEVTEEKIMEVAKASTAEGETIFNMPFEVTAESVYAAIMAADALGNWYLDQE